MGDRKTEGMVRGRAGRRGSSASDKAIAFAVRDEKRVRFSLDRATVTGWVMGLDDYHYVVLGEEFEVVLVHKSCPLVQVLDQPLEAETADTQRVVRRFTAGFRSRMLEEFFSQSQSA